MFLLFKDAEDYRLTFAMTFVTQCSLLHLRGKNSFLDKINDKLTCTGNLKLSTAIFLLVEVECSSFYLLHIFNLFLSEMFELCRMQTRLKIKK